MFTRGNTVYHIKEKKTIVNDLISSHISSTKHKIERGYLKRGERSKTGARLGVLMKSMSL